MSELNNLLANSAGFLLSRAHRLMREKADAALQPLGLSLQEYIVLRLVSLKEKPPQGALGDTYGIDPAGMVALSDKLEQSGLLQRQRDPADRRRNILTITPKGSKVVARAQRYMADLQKEFLAPLEPEEWEIVRASLWKLVQTHDPHLRGKQTSGMET